MQIKLIALFTAAVLLAGCNTIEGFGKDLRAAGTFLVSGSKKEDKPEPAPAPAPQQQQPAKR